MKRHGLVSLALESSLHIIEDPERIIDQLKMPRAFDLFFSITSDAVFRFLFLIDCESWRPFIQSWYEGSGTRRPIR
jgi:hypothetical protein